MDYENATFRCEIFHQISHVQEAFPQATTHPKMKKSHASKSISWQPYELPLLDVEDDLSAGFLPSKGVKNSNKE